MSRLSFLESRVNLVEIQVVSRPKDCWGKEGKEKGKGGAH